MKVVLGLFAAFALCACAVIPLSQEEIAKCGPRPTEIQAEKAVEAYVENSGFKDPDTVKVRNIVIRKPLKMFRGLAAGGGWNYGWEIDFETNGKNSYGAYAGYVLHSILFAPDGTVHWQPGE